MPEVCVDQLQRTWIPDFRKNSGEIWFADTACQFGSREKDGAISRISSIFDAVTFKTGAFDEFQIQQDESPTF